MSASVPAVLSRLEVEDAVAQIAKDTRVDMVSLRARVWISLAGLEAQSDRQISDIIKEEAYTLQVASQTVDNMFIDASSVDDVDLRKSRLTSLPPQIGEQISTTVHYLGTARSTAQHFGLTDIKTGRLIGYSAINNLDWPLLINAIDSLNLDVVEHLSLSRVYTSQFAPRNTISRMLSLLTKSLQKNHRATLTTIVDQNLGFGGESYKASNWKRIFSVPHLGYLYVDGNFHTRRSLIEKFGTDNQAELFLRLGARLKASGPMPLTSAVYATGTHRAIREYLVHSAHKTLIRPESRAAR